MKETRVYTHGDLDGVACAILLKLYRGRVRVHFCNYDNVDKQLTDFIKEPKNGIDELFITDICPSEATCDHLDKLKSVSVRLFDHHKTKSWVTKYRWATFNNDLCGAELVANYIDTLTEEQDDFVKAVAAWDLWKIDSPFRERGEKLNTLVRFMGIYNFMKDFSEDITLDMSDSFRKITKYIEDNKKAKVKQTLHNQLPKARRFMDGRGNTFKILFASDYISEVGHEALNHADEGDLDYVVILNPTHNHCGLRSRGNVDVSQVAKQLRGGGHKAAAGFIVDFRKRLTKTISNMLSKIES